MCPISQASQRKGASDSDKMRNAERTQQAQASTLARRMYLSGGDSQPERSLFTQSVDRRAGDLSLRKGRQTWTTKACSRR
jgi:hypothetical protein